MTPPVVAVMTGAPTDRAVLTVAANEALLRHCPLHLMTATGDLPRSATTPTRALALAAATLTTTRPALSPTTTSSPHTLTDAVTTASATATAVVADHRTSYRVVGRLRCPLLSVPTPLVSSPGPVLVAVDLADTESQELLAYAFAAADARGRPLRVTFAWTAPAAADFRPMTPFELLTTHGDLERLLAEVLAGWSATYPDVTVERDEIRCHDVATTLVRATAKASLMVLGARPHPARVVGPITRAVMATARCPAAVVPLGEPR